MFNTNYIKRCSWIKIEYSSTNNLLAQISSFNMRLLFIVIIFLLTIPIAYAWGWDTHATICKWIHENNANLNKRLDKDEFIRGCIAPDKEYKDSINHHCYVAKECKGINVSQTNPGGLPYFTDIEACIEEGYFDCPAFAKFDEAIENSTKSNFSFYVGVATHYFTDSHVPVHQTMGEDYWDCHLPFEQQIDGRLSRNERFWTVTQQCEVYFPCYKAGTQNRKCKAGYDAEITYSYEDIVEVAGKTDSAISKKLGIEEGDYSHLLERVGKKPTGLFTLILNRIAELLSRIFNV